jgi:hypothetical protein
VHHLIAQGPSGGWSTGAAILTFVFPMLLFIAVAGALYILYTKPEVVPGHQVRPLERPVSYTAVPGPPTAGQGQAAPAEGDGAAATSAGPSAGAGADQAATTGDAE